MIGLFECFSRKGGGVCDSTVVGLAGAHAIYRHLTVGALSRTENIVGKLFLSDMHAVHFCLTDCLSSRGRRLSELENRRSPPIASCQNWTFVPPTS